MMLLRLPPWKMPTVTTEGSLVMSTLRETMVCMPITICAPTTIGSTPRHGIAACVCEPRTKMRIVSEDAISGPER